MWTEVPQTPGLPSADGTDMSHGEIARSLWRLETGQAELSRRVRRMEIIMAAVVTVGTMLGSGIGATVGGLIGG